jgi:hypothetical protein
MNPAYLSALSALAGSVIGGTTSFLSSWLAQGVQSRAQLLLFDKGRRQELYREFVDEASSLYIDALTRDAPDLSKTIKLYALISRMRVVSSSKVIEEALRVGQLIVASYTEPNKSFEEIRAMVSERALDPLCAFSEACREELQQLKVL